MDVLGDCNIQQPTAAPESEYTPLAGAAGFSTSDWTQIALTQVMLKMALLILGLASVGVFAAHAYEAYRGKGAAPFVFTAEPGHAKPAKRACHLKTA